MGRVKRSNALSWIFMRYVLVMLGSLVGLVIVAWLRSEERRVGKEC